MIMGEMNFSPIIYPITFLGFLGNEQREESKSRVNYNYVINGSIHNSKYRKVSNK